MKGNSVTVTNADLKNSLDCLQQEVRKIKFPGSIDYQSLSRGGHADLVSVLRHLFCDYSSALTGHLNRLGYELAGKDERRFLETVYLLMRDQLDYRPAVTCAQFLSQSYPSRKAALVSDICRLARDLAARVRRPAVQRTVFDPDRLLGSGRRDPHAAAATEEVPAAAAAVVERPRSAGGGISGLPRAQVVREPRGGPHRAASCGGSPRGVGVADSAQGPIPSAAFPLAARYATMPVTAVVASEDEPPQFASRGFQTGPWAAEQRMAELAGSLAQQVADLAARLTLLEQRVARLDGAPAPYPPQSAAPAAAASYQHALRQQPPAPAQQQQPLWSTAAAPAAIFTAASSNGVAGGRLVQGRLQSSSEDFMTAATTSSTTATADFRRRPPVSPSPPPPPPASSFVTAGGLRTSSRSREALGSEEARPPVPPPPASTAEAEDLRQDLLTQARRIERLIAGTQSLLGSSTGPMVRASAE